MGHVGAAKTVLRILHVPAVQEVAAAHVSAEREEEVVAVLAGDRALE